MSPVRSEAHTSDYPVPPALELLLEASEPEVREKAWSELLNEFSNLIRHVARQLGGDADAVMDSYAAVLQALRANDFHRLRQFRYDGRGKFSTWLVAVTRRVCIDKHRRLYGRAQREGTTPDWKASRRNLAQLLGDEVTLDSIETTADNPEIVLEKRELHEALFAALEPLAPRERLLLRYRYEDGLSVPEIARLTGARSPFIVYREIEKLLTALRASLEKVGFGSDTATNLKIPAEHPWHD